MAGTSSTGLRRSVYRCREAAGSLTAQAATELFQVWSWLGCMQHGMYVWHASAWSLLLDQVHTHTGWHALGGTGWDGMGWERKGLSCQRATMQHAAAFRSTHRKTRMAPRTATASLSARGSDSAGSSTACHHALPMNFNRVAKCKGACAWHAQAMAVRRVTCGASAAHATFLHPLAQWRR